MHELIEWLSQPWPWYVAGPLIAIIMALFILFGKSLGISSNLRTMCAAIGVGKRISYFDFDWKAEGWNLVFAAGLVLGGFLASTFLMNGEGIQLAESTTQELVGYGMAAPAGSDLVPPELFSWEALGSPLGLLMLVGGGFLIGFGTRYGSGCTSGHAISGLSNLQLPSLIATISFFGGGLLVTNFVLPYLLGK